MIKSTTDANNVINTILIKLERYKRLKVAICRKKAFCLCQAIISRTYWSFEQDLLWTVNLIFFRLEYESNPKP